MADEKNPYEIYERTTLAIKALRLERGDAIAVHFPDNMDPQQMAAAAELMSEAGKEWGVHILALTGGITVEHLPKKEMNRLGWYNLHDRI